MHAFTVLARVIADHRFTPVALGLSAATMGPSTFERMNAQIGSVIVELTNEWIAGLEGENATTDAIEKKIEELAWFTAVVYGVGGWAGRQRSQNKEFNADFFLYVFMFLT